MGKGVPFPYATGVAITLCKSRFYNLLFYVEGEYIMKIGSLYIVQTAIIGLSDVPLEAKSSLCQAFKPIFTSKNCFADEGVNINDLKSNEEFSNAPYINQMGQLRFNKRSVNFFPSSYQDIGQEESSVFGRNKDLEDQRMNFLYFELNKPLKLLAQYGGKTVASGKIFLHVYPAGYIVVHLAVYMRGIRDVEIKSERDLLKWIRETRPDTNGDWKWKSKFGCLSLKETVRKVSKCVSDSLFPKKDNSRPILEWKAGVAVTTDLSEGNISQAIMKANDTTHPFVEFGHNYDGEYPQGILVAPNRVHYYFADSCRDRKSILHSFWKITHIYEFLLCKNTIYDDYLGCMQKDRNKIRELSLKRKNMFNIANIIGKDFYNDTFIPYTQALDKYTTMLGPRYRAIYALFSKVYGFDSKRKKLNNELKEWEEDLKEWNNRDTGIRKLVEFLFKAKDIFSR